MGGLCGQEGSSVQGVCAASPTAAAGQMQGRFGMGHGTGRGGFSWLGLSIILSLVLLGLGSIFSMCSCFPASSPCSEAGAVGRVREEGEGGAAVGGGFPGSLNQEKTWACGLCISGKTRLAFTWLQKSSLRVQERKSLKAPVQLHGTTGTIGWHLWS